ncbi:MAG TPA: hypothetical protein VGK94_03305 [Candidatus Polarisedimenticolia bacterium]
MLPSIVVLLALLCPNEVQTPDPNTAGAPQSGKPAARRPVDMRVFNNISEPLTGLWDLEIPDLPSRKIEMKVPEAGPPNSLVGVDLSSREEILRLTRRKQGLGYEGQLLRVLAPCGVDTLVISEFLPLGEAAVIRFETRPTSMPCPSIDGGRAGRFFAVSRGGGPVRLRDFGEISSSGVRETYSIGGDRPNVERAYEIPLGSVSVDDGVELRFIQRVKAPLDGAYWFQVEAVLAAGSQAEAPRGYLAADQIRFLGSLTLKRAR